MTERFANEPATTLNGTITSGATSLIVASSTGFPAVNFRIRIDNEYLLVTTVAGTTWTVTRALEGSTAVSHSNAAAVAHVLTAGGLTQALLESGTASTLRLDYVAATDLMSGTSIPINTWTDVTANQTFTVGSASSLIVIACMVGMSAGGGSAAAKHAGRVLIDSAGTPIAKKMGGGNQEVGAQYINPFDGGQPVTLTGLAPGSHTVKAQVRCDTASTSGFLRASSTPETEHLNLQVLEIP